MLHLFDGRCQGKEEIGINYKSGIARTAGTARAARTIKVAQSAPNILSGNTGF